MKEKPWQGRFTESTDAFVEAFTASIDFDKRLYKYDIKGSIAHALMLNKSGILSDSEYRQIKTGLTEILNEITDGKIEFSISLEDIHMNIESILTEKIGDVGKKLHTGRSRNDQVATDIRLYCRDETDNIKKQITLLMEQLLSVAKIHTHTIMPGFTHLQIAQPITFGHHMMAWFEMLKRDYQRYEDSRKRTNINPLGAAALAGTTYPIDRNLTTEELNFDVTSENSLDSVSDRDFIIELISASSILMMHLTRFSEELIIWSTSQFNFVELSDSFSTGSSIMPQKKNPDVPELIRGKSGRVFGHLFSILTIMKSQPLAYNKDNQEDKEPLFDVIDNIKGCLKVFTEMMPNISINKERMHQSAKEGFSTATDLADYLVKKGIPFRSCHDIVGSIVKYALDNNLTLPEISLAKYKEFNKLVESDVFDILTVEGSVNSRNHYGATAPNQVSEAINRAYKYIDNIKNNED
ncbi:MAG: argininosuccinate lyase [Methylococcales bacterium]|jgi:argininosuccinate lyase|nr:argininosuccinate lyase [Methylococcales bacterium]